MSEKNRIAIVGATGEMGTALLSALEEQDIPSLTLYAVASDHSVDETVTFNNRALLVESLNDFDFKKVDIALFAVPAPVALQFIPKAQAAGCKVLDHSSAYLFDDVAILSDAQHIPDASLITIASPLAMVLANVVNAIQPLATVTAIYASVLQPVSAWGRAGVRELAGQTGELLNARGITPSVFPVQMAFNILPSVGEAKENQLMDELEKLIPNPVPVVLNEAIVPVFYGMTVGLTVQTQQALSLTQAQARLEKAGFSLKNNDENQEVINPVGDASQTQGVVMSDLTSLPAPLQGFKVWLLTDNIRQVVLGLTIQVIEKWKKRL